MPKGQLGDWIREAIKLTPGTRMRLAPGIRNMIMHESGGNPRAINNWDSNAAAGTPSIGLMQTIQPTFNAHALKGHKNIYNPVDNIMAGLMYAISRYGHKMVRQGGRPDAYGNYIGY
jgi:SLT domain-containing protein